MTLSFVTWNVDPVIVSFGELGIRWYGLLFALSFVFGYIIMGNIFKKEGLTQELLDKLSIYMAIATVVGARVGHCLFYQPDYYLQHPFEILQIWKGGLASHGAAIGILFALYIFARTSHKSYWWILDRIVIVVALSGVLIRTGNLMNSEIFGKPCDLPWAFKFVRDNTLPRHPTQIYEAFAYLLIFIYLMLGYYRKNLGTKPGFLFGIFLISLFTVRFLIEFVKENQVNFEDAMFLNMGQFLSIPFVLAGILIIYFSKQGKLK